MTTACVSSPAECLNTDGMVYSADHPEEGLYKWPEANLQRNLLRMGDADFFPAVIGTSGFSNYELRVYTSKDSTYRSIEVSFFPGSCEEKDFLRACNLALTCFGMTDETPDYDSFSALVKSEGTDMETDRGGYTLRFLVYIDGIPYKCRAVISEDADGYRAMALSITVVIDGQTVQKLLRISCY